MYKRIKNILIALIILLILFTSCQNDNDDEDDDYWDIPVYFNIDGLPVSLPDGKKILYYHAGIKTIYTNGSVEVNEDSAGLWLINIDGTNPHLILKGGLGNWWDISPDGDWIGFEDGGQIYRVPMIGDSIVVNQKQQLTFDGSNFFPAISPDGDWIVYDSNNESPDGGYRIWIMTDNGTDNSLIVGGRMPCWSNNQKWIYYIGLYAEIYKVNIGITSEVSKVTHLNVTNIYSADNCNPKCSPDGTKIVFESNGQICITDSAGNNLKQLTTDGGINPDWIDNSTIVYIGFKPRGSDIEDFLRNHGTLWIMDVDGNNKKQLTFFNGDVISQ
jgi:Tol biopolymer transport system component